MKRVEILILILFSLVFANCAASRYSAPGVDVWSSGGDIIARAVAPIPMEVENKTQSLALARDAAISKAQIHLLTYVLGLKTRSGKPLSEAEVPSLSLQENIRGVISQARVVQTKYKDDQCLVLIAVDKDNVRPFLKKN